MVRETLPSFAGAVEWLNSKPLTPAGLRGKVVLVQFWTYTCVNWLRTLPYVRAWSAKYEDKGLVVIGVHTPEFGFEKNIDNIGLSCRNSERLLASYVRHLETYCYRQTSPETAKGRFSAGR
jgi:thiol-disulfide isomerase/thioredoxin